MNWLTSLFCPWTAAIVAILAVLFGALGGCGPSSLPAAMPAEFYGVVDKIAVMVEDQGVLDEFVSDVDGHVQNPGIATYVTVTVEGGVRLVGVNGNVVLETFGTGSQLPSGVRAELIKQLSGPLSDERRAAILAILGWNRVPSDHNPPPG
jgi:hypothetical protein